MYYIEIPQEVTNENAITLFINLLNKEVDSSLSKNQPLISETTAITIIINYTMTSKKVT